jgi:ligand-binding sensor domain-containing protein
MESVNVVREDPTDPDILYVGTDLGVFVSLDRGSSWRSLSATLPTTSVQDLVVHPRDGEIVIGTHGRSVWVADLAAVRMR